ncbi:MAG: helix-turn-helix domain-containing protein [Lachnospiraceae bacterium]|nr:helix-turn-helix domain-containing protein [Lachnospiraceae bacterium]
MILADKIINERKKNGWSQEELAEMLDVSRQSVSKWEGAQSVPDLQKILKMAEIFGVTTDYLLKDEIEPEDTVSYNEGVVKENGGNLRRVSMEEASEFIALKKQILPKIGLGVFLCITSPVVLIFLAGLQDSGLTGISENACVAIGLLWLFVHIGIAVFLFITKGRKLEKYKFFETDDFETEYGVDGMVKEKLSDHESINTRALTTGVLMCVLGAVPLVITSVLGFSKFVIVCMVCLLLLLVGTAVYLFVSVCGVNGTYKMILQIDDYTRENKKKSIKLEPLTRVYWMLIVVIFLAVSFLTQRWDRTWIIWAVSGVLYALIRVIAESFIKED